MENQGLLQSRFAIAPMEWIVVPDKKHHCDTISMRRGRKVIKIPLAIMARPRVNWHSTIC